MTRDTESSKHSHETLPTARGVCFVVLCGGIRGLHSLLRVRISWFAVERKKHTRLFHSLQHHLYYLTFLSAAPVDRVPNRENNNESPVIHLPHKRTRMEDNYTSSIFLFVLTVWEREKGEEYFKTLTDWLTMKKWRYDNYARENDWEDDWEGVWNEWIRRGFEEVRPGWKGGRSLCLCLGWIGDLSMLPNKLCVPGNSTPVYTSKECTCAVVVAHALEKSLALQFIHKDIIIKQTLP